MRVRCVALVSQLFLYLIEIVKGICFVRFFGVTFWKEQLSIARVKFLRRALNIHGINLSRFFCGSVRDLFLQWRIRWFASSGSPAEQCLQVNFMLLAMSVL